MLRVLAFLSHRHRRLWWLVVKRPRRRGGGRSLIMIFSHSHSRPLFRHAGMTTPVCIGTCSSHLCCPPALTEYVIKHQHSQYLNSPSWRSLSARACDLEGRALSAITHSISPLQTRVSRLACRTASWAQLNLSCGGSSIKRGSSGCFPLRARPGCAHF